ncbi:MAG: hypothetical protein Q8M01_11460 [Rubrivivax sp.]|nr:hypothetical protein [Rubrivivax sp.]
MNTDDSHAFAGERRRKPAATAHAPRRAVWPWVLLALFVLALLLAASGAALLLALADGAREGVNVTIDGERWGHFELDRASWPLAFAGVALALLVMMVVVPCAVLLALVAAAVGIGVALLALLVVAAVALSPLWLIVLVLWLILRRRPRGAATMQT